MDRPGDLEGERTELDEVFLLVEGARLLPLGVPLRLPVVRDRDRPLPPLRMLDERF